MEREPEGGPGHETRDVDVRVVTRIGLALGLGLVVLAGAGWFLLGHMRAREARLSPPASPLAAAYGRREPPAPRLQAAPRKDLERLRAEEDALLHGYGWVDREAGVVRIPIERAMALLAGRGGGGS